MDILDNAQPDGSRILGYFSSLDQYRNAVLARWSDRRSNEIEIVYVDYLSLSGNLDRAESVIAHEFMHMVQWARDPNESTWVNEGIAVYAEWMLGYEVESRISVFEENPDTSLLDWDNTVEDYGAAYLFFAYISEQFDGIPTIASIVRNRNSGTRGVESALATLGKSVSFGDLFSDWAVANYLDDPELNNGKYGYSTLDINLESSEVEDFYPIAHKTSKVKPWSARYTEFKKLQDDTLNLTVYKNDGDDIVAQLIDFGDKTEVSSIKSNATPLATVTIPPEGSVAVLVVTSQPEFVVPGAVYSDYKYSAEVQAVVTPVEPTSNRRITTWGALKSN